MQIATPRNTRELFELFRLYDHSGGLSELLSKCTFEGVTPHQVYWSALRRLPDNKAAIAPWSYDPKVQLTNALNSVEFQSKLLSLFINAYPEKTRVLFIHVPKCAGSHLTSIVANKFAALTFRLADKNWYGPKELFSGIKKLADQLSYTDSLFIYGHITLNWFASKDYIRFGDRAFTVVRHPLDLVMSQINYILTRFEQDPERVATDTRDWLRFINPHSLQSAFETRDFRNLASEMLHTPQLVRANLICEYLGQGTAESAFDLCASTDIEIAHMDCYSEWLKVRWNGSALDRVNASGHYVSMNDLGSDESQRVNAIVGEDKLFVRKVTQIMQEHKQCFVFGRQLRS